jgi:hypothetical protein
VDVRVGWAVSVYVEVSLGHLLTVTILCLRALDVVVAAALDVPVASTDAASAVIVTEAASVVVVTEAEDAVVATVTVPATAFDVLAVVKSAQLINRSGVTDAFHLH